MFELVFFTSSRIKMQHARYLSRGYDVRIINFNEATSLANYFEPRIYNREELLQQSFESALAQFKKARKRRYKYFIIEDTSVDIHALTRKYGYEYPGLDVKYWMEDIEFEDLDLELEMLGGDRSVTIRSDVVLYLPGVSEKPIVFTGRALGNVTKTPREFSTNVVYPWLDNKTFNKWFQPRGERNVLSMLPIEKADKHDFRKKSFEQLFDTLERYHLIDEKESSKPKINSQPPWFEKLNCHIVYGLSCAGKTTIANYLINEYNFLHVEASDFMQLIYRQYHGLSSDVSIGEFSKAILTSHPYLVAEKVLEYINKIGHRNVIITGFRLLEEVEYIESFLGSEYQMSRVLISANSALRKDRKNTRKRPADRVSVEGLEDRDERELEMGIAQLMNEHEKAIELKNEKDFDSFYEGYTSKMNLIKLNRSIKNNKKNKELNVDDLTLRQLIVLALYDARDDLEKSEFFTTTEITSLVNRLGPRKDKYVTNVGRFFKMNTNELFEVDVVRGTRKYRLSNTGAGFAKLILQNFEF